MENVLILTTIILGINGTIKIINVYSKINRGVRILTDDKKINIGIARGCRSDHGLTKGLIRRLEEHTKFECYIINLEPADFIESYQITENYLHDMKFGKFDCPSPNIEFDLVLITGDRIEMAGCASAAFHNGVKIAHFYAGIVNSPLSTLDDVNRHVITLWSDIAFCEDRESTRRVFSLWITIGKIDKKEFYVNLKPLSEYRIHEVGISHLDDLEIDKSLVPDEPYDLVLYNPTTAIKEDMKLGYFENDLVIFIQPNPDSKEFMKDWNIAKKKSFKNEIFYDNLPRSQFFGLLKNCSRFIGNSSSAYYEALHFLREDQIIMIGERNKNRSTPKKLEIGASDKIVKILEEYFSER